MTLYLARHLLYQNNLEKRSSNFLVSCGYEAVNQQFSVTLWITESKSYP